ncbi:MAG: PRC-barrel domain-containing protein [Nanoarchaeota archaeon]
MRVKRLSNTIGLKVYTDSGDFFGEIEEANLVENKVDSWRIRVGSGIGNLIGGAKGVIIPNQFIKSMNDIVIINRSALPSESEEAEVM